MLIYLKKKLKELEAMGGTIETIGKTTLGHDIYALIVGDKKAKKRIIVQAAIHAREWATCHIALMQAEDMLKKENSGFCYAFIPCVNVDGVLLSTAGHLTQYKANARGVDLNTNFDADWGQGIMNIKYENYENYIGRVANSESETQALINYTLEFLPQITFSYHARGREIYFDFFQNPENYKRDEKIAQIVSKSTGYKIYPSGKSSGGYKDWCIRHMGICAITLEMFEMLEYPLSNITIKEEYERLKNFLIDIRNCL